MSGGLQYDLTIGTKTALKQVDEFIEDARKRFKAAAIDLTASTKGGNSGSSGGGANKAQKSAIDEEEKNEKRRQQMLKDAMNQIVLIETSMGRKLVDQRKKTIRDMKDLAGQMALDPAQFRRDAAVLVARYRADIVDDQSAGRKDLAGVNTRLRQAENESNRLYEIRSNAIYRIDQLEQSFGVRLTNERSQLEARLTKLVQNGNNARISDIQRAVNAEIAAFQRTARAASQATPAASQGKNLQYVFQAQQAIEDFSYAGLRGASNNLALMASQLGGPAGIIALLGITAVQLGPLTAKMMGFSDAVGESEKRTAAMNRSLADLLAVKTGDWWNSDVVDSSTEAVKRYEESIESAKDKIEAMQMTNTNWQEAEGMLLNLKEARRNFWAMAATEAAPEDMEIQRQIIEDVKNEIIALEPHWQGSLETVEQIDEVLKSIREGMIDLPAQIAKENKELEQKLEKLKEIKAISEEEKNRIEQVRTSRGYRDGESFKAMPNADSSPDKIKIKELEREIKYWEEQANKSLKAGSGFAFDAQSGHANKLAEDLQQYKNVVEAVKKAEKEQLDQAKEAVREQKEKNREKESELNTQRQIVKEIEKEQKNAQFKNATGDSQTRQGMTNNALGKMKERDEQIIGMSPNQDWQKMMTHQMNQYYDALQARADRFFAQEQNNILKAQAESAKDIGDPKEQRRYLEELQQFQRQQAMNAKTPQEANWWYQQSLETQKLIEESFKAQKKAEEEKIEKIKEQIKSVEDLEKRVEELSQAINDVPLLDMQNQAVLDYLANVKQEIIDIINLQQQIKGSGGNGAGAGGGGGPLPAGFGGGDFGWLGGGAGGGVGQPAGFKRDNGQPFNYGPFGLTQTPNDRGGLSLDWANADDFGFLSGAGSGNGMLAGLANGGPMTANSPYMVGEEGPELIMPNHSGSVFDARTTSRMLSSVFSSLPQAMSGTGAGTVNNRNLTIGNMPITVQGGNFDPSHIVNAARSAAVNATLRRGV